MTYASTSPLKTRHLARQMAAAILKHPRLPVTLELTGELGAGKTTFTQAFLKTLGVTSRVASPTFLILKSFRVRKIPSATAYHIDCYRLHAKNDPAFGYIASALSDPRGIAIIEWPERLPASLKLKRSGPGRNRIRLDFAHGATVRDRRIRVRGLPRLWQVKAGILLPHTS